MVLPSPQIFYEKSVSSAAPPQLDYLACSVPVPPRTCGPPAAPWLSQLPFFRHSVQRRGCGHLFNRHHIHFQVCNISENDTNKLLSPKVFVLFMQPIKS